MNKSFLAAIMLFLASTVNTYSCDTNDPICVASMVFEKGASLRFFELKDYYCEQNQVFLSEAIRRAEKRVSKLKRDKGIDHYEQVKIDFSDVEYSLISRDKEKAQVRVFGVFTYDLQGTDFHHQASTDEIMELRYQNDRWMFCSEELANLSDRFKHANKEIKADD
ncbi:MAG: hypothetical protein AB7D06_18690 [Pedobacter sp.]